MEHLPALWARNQMRRGLAEKKSLVETSRGLEREKAARLLRRFFPEYGMPRPSKASFVQVSYASHDPEMAYSVGMNWLLVMAALACNPGDRLVDLRDKIPRGLNSIDLMVTVEPFYARFYIYQPGFPDSLQHCCGNKPSSIIKVPVVDGRFCIRQSQPRMKWTVRALFRPDIQM